MGLVTTRRFNHTLAPPVRKLFQRMPWDLLRRLSGKRWLFPLYHMVDEAPVAHVAPLYTHLDPASFERDLDYLLARYEPVGLNDLLDYLAGRRDLPRNFLHLTMDDGMRQVREVMAPILLRKGVPATLFICRDFTDNRALFYRHKAALLVNALKRSDEPARNRTLEWLRQRGVQAATPEQAVLAVPYHSQAWLDELAPGLALSFEDYLRQAKPYLDRFELSQLADQGFTLGAHSIDHPLYRLLPLAEQVEQTRASVEFVRRCLGQNCRTFSFPYNEVGVEPAFYDQVGSMVETTFGLSLFQARPKGPVLQRCPLDRSPSVSTDQALSLLLANHVLALARTHVCGPEA